MSLNVIALISGGKDSLYSLLHCLHAGHTIVALANLYPPPPQPEKRHDHATDVATDNFAFAGLNLDEDLNSFLYQTVGHSIVPLYAEALQLPLYRRAIQGNATQDGKSYEPTSLPQRDDSESLNEDETESLTQLLTDIKERHPEVNAVSSGAILSTYQRIRVESVATRLGLTPLSFLWMYPVLSPPSGRQESLSGLLDDMAASGCSARIIKTASGGIDESSLWCDVTTLSTRRRLIKGMRPYFPADDSVELRGAIVGEGGEYETLALSGPRKLWRRGRIEIDETKVKHLKGEGGVSWINFLPNTARVVPWNEKNDIKAQDTSLPVPGLLDRRFPAILELELAQVTMTPEQEDETPDPMSPERDSDSSIASRTLLITSQAPCPEPDGALFQSKSTSHGSPILQISNLIYRSPVLHGDVPTPHVPPTFDTQICNVLLELSTVLKSLDASHRSIIHATLFLRDMSSFAVANKTYSGFFPKGMSWPPARVCVSLGDQMDGFDKDVEIVLSVLVDTRVKASDQDARREREKYWRGLHVQSRSYWAPANIGPYSQAIAVKEHLRGQPDTKTDARNEASDLNMLNPMGDEDDADLRDGPEFELIYLAGQIPLVPNTMELLPGAFLDKAVLSLQHLWRVAQERGCDFWAGAAIAYLPSGARSINESRGEKSSLSGYDDTQHRQEEVQVCCDVWQQANIYGTGKSLSEEDETEPDPWERQFNRLQDSSQFVSSIDLAQGQSTQDVHLHSLPNLDLMAHCWRHTQEGLLISKRSAGHQIHIPPLLILEVASLPRHADIEWSATGLRLNLEGLGGLSDTELKLSSGSASVSIQTSGSDLVKATASWFTVSPAGTNKRRADDPGHGRREWPSKSAMFLTLFFPLDTSWDDMADKEAPNERKSTNKHLHINCAQPESLTDIILQLTRAINSTQFPQPQTPAGARGGNGGPHDSVDTISNLSAPPAARPSLSPADTTTPQPHIVTGTVYHRELAGTSQLHHSYSHSILEQNLMLVPCRRVWGARSRTDASRDGVMELDMAVEVRVDVVH